MAAVAQQTTSCALKLHGLHKSCFVTQCAFACHDLAAGLSCSVILSIAGINAVQEGAQDAYQKCAKKLKKSVKSTCKGPALPWDVDGRFDKQVADKYLNSVSLGLFGVVTAA